MGGARRKVPFLDRSKRKVPLNTKHLLTMTFQIALLLACGLTVTLGSAMSHTSVYVPHQSKYGTRIEHGHRKPWPVTASTQWHRSRDSGHRITHESHKITHDSQEIGRESHKISHEVGFENTGRVDPSTLGFEPPTGYSYSSVSKQEKGGAWSRVDVHIGRYHVPTSYSSFNLYSTK